MPYTEILHKLCKSSQKRLDLAKSRDFLPQPANYFIRIYPSYPWHFATLQSIFSWTNGISKELWNRFQHQMDGFSPFLNIICLIFGPRPNGPMVNVPDCKQWKVISLEAFVTTLFIFSCPLEKETGTCTTQMGSLCHVKIDASVKKRETVLLPSYIYNFAKHFGDINHVQMALSHFLGTDFVFLMHWR